MSTRALYTFTGTMIAAWTDRTTGKRHAAKRDHSWNVYKHGDGCPTGAAEAIAAALPFAWTLPRYEADEFASAFIAANKSHWRNAELRLLREVEALNAGPANEETGKALVEAKNDLETVRRYADNGGGGVRLMPQGNPLRVAERNCADIQYRYEISLPKGERQLRVKCFAVSCARGGNEKTIEALLFVGNLTGFTRWANDEEAREQAEREAQNKHDAAKAATKKRRLASR